MGTPFTTVLRWSTQLCHHNFQNGAHAMQLIQKEGRISNGDIEAARHSLIAERDSLLVLHALTATHTLHPETAATAPEVYRKALAIASAGSMPPGNPSTDTDYALQVSTESGLGFPVQTAPTAGRSDHLTPSQEKRGDGGLSTSDPTAIGLCTPAPAQSADPVHPTAHSAQATTSGEQPTLVVKASCAPAPAQSANLVHPTAHSAQATTSGEQPTVVKASFAHSRMVEEVVKCTHSLGELLTEGYIPFHPISLDEIICNAHDGDWEWAEGIFYDLVYQCQAEADLQERAESLMRRWQKLPWGGV